MYLTDEYVTWAIRQIKLGRRHHMPGISTYADCGEYYRNDHTGIHWCPTCRTNHDRICTTCGTRFDGEPTGIRTCKSCRNQHALF